MPTPEERYLEAIQALQQRGASTRAQATDSRTGGMESLQEAMAAGQPTAQDAWTTAIAGALPALLGGLFAGKEGLRAGAEGGVVGAGTSMKISGEERARKEKYGALTAKTKFDQAKELDKEARTYDTQAAKGGLDSAMQRERIESSEGIAARREAAANARTTARINAANDKPGKKEPIYDPKVLQLQKEFRAELTARGLYQQLAGAEKLISLTNPKYDNAYLQAQLPVALSKASGDTGNVAVAERALSAPGSLSQSAQELLRYITSGAKGTMPKASIKAIHEVGEIYKEAAEEKTGGVREQMKKNYPGAADIIENFGRISFDDAPAGPSLEAIAKKRGLVQDANGKWSKPNGSK